jgi:hypothetical protein
VTAVVGWMFVWQGAGAQSPQFYVAKVMPCAQ